MKKKLSFLALIPLLLYFFVSGECLAQTAIHKSSQRFKVVIDNDFCGDPDGLFQLAHQLLCSTCDICAIVGSCENGAQPGQAMQSCNKARKVLELLGMKGKAKVVQGADHNLSTTCKPVVSDGAKAIVELARECTAEHPLYVLCGGSLSDIASAHLIDPPIDDRVVLVWIGGQEYDTVSTNLPPGASKVEYNLGLSIPAAQVVFNESRIRIWQVPRNAYRQCLYSIGEMETKLRSCGPIGEYLLHEVNHFLGQMEQAVQPMGEVYILGDSPLVLLSALQCGFNADPSSSQYRLLPCPIIKSDGSYGESQAGRPIRVYEHLDTRLMFADMEAKLNQLKNK